MLSPANGLPVSPLQVDDLIVLKERLMLQQQHIDVLLAERAVAALANYRDKLQLHAHLHHLNGAGHRAFIPPFLPNFPVLQQVEQSLNEPSDRVKSSRYKTELCRPYEEMGACKYGEKCQFAHGIHELRVLPRHPKYKTELCRTYHTSGFCPYGPRCHFIHNPGDMEMELAAAEQQHLMHTPPSREHKLLTAGSLPGSPNSSSGSQSPESEKSVFDFNDDALSFAIERYLSIDEDSSAPNTPPSSPNNDHQQEKGKPRFYPFGHGTDGPAY